MDDTSKGGTSAITKQVLAGLKGPTVFNGEMSRLTPGLTFKDVVPQEVQQSLNMASPGVGKMVDTWVQRRPNAKV